jgi:hypothetical protein
MWAAGAVVVAPIWIVAIVGRRTIIGRIPPITTCITSLRE